MQSIAVVDTETTSLHRDRLPWEVAIITNRHDDWRVWRLFVDVVTTANTDPESLRVGDWHTRFPHDEPVVLPGDDPTGDPRCVYHPVAAARLVQHLTTDAWIIGANPAFDMGALANLLALDGMQPAWKYRPVDVENYVAAQATPPRMPEGLPATAERVGVDPANYDLHTAVGDACLALEVAARVGLVTGDVRVKGAGT